MFFEADRNILGINLWDKRWQGWRQKIHDRERGVGANAKWFETGGVANHVRRVEALTTNIKVSKIIKNSFLISKKTLHPGYVSAGLYTSYTVLNVGLHHAAF